MPLTPPPGSDSGARPPWQEDDPTPLPSPTTAGGGGQVQRDTQQVVHQALRDSPAGVIPIRFSIGNLQGTATEQMFRVIAVDGSSAQGAAIGVPLISRGSIVAMTCASDVTRTSGAARFQSSISGSASAVLEWDTGTFEQETFDSGTYPFAIGDLLTMNVTTQGFAPTGANVEVVVYVVQTQ